VYLIRDVNRSDLVDRVHANTEQIQSAVLLRLSAKGGDWVIAVGFRTQQDFTSSEPAWRERHERLRDAVGSGDWPGGAVPSFGQLIQAITDTMQRVADLDEMISQLGKIIHQSLNDPTSEAHTSIWLLDFDRAGDQGEVIPVLRQDPQSFACGLRNSAVTEVRLDQGIIGWVAASRSPVNVSVDDPEAVLPGPEEVKVRERYLSLKHLDATKVELALPMIYKGRLVGVLNLEKPTPGLFSNETEEMARACAVLVAQAIHQLQIDHFFTHILEADNLHELATAIVLEVGRLIEAPFASIHLWDEAKQCLRLEASSTRIVGPQGREVRVGDPCYLERGIGFIRWAFENKMWLRVPDIDTINNPGHHQHRAVMAAVVAEVRAQLATTWEVNIDQVQVGEVQRPRDVRRFWRFRTRGRDGGEREEEVAQAIWDREYRDQGGHSCSLITVPILDVENSAPALGVLRFSRRNPKLPFTDFDVGLLRKLARPGLSQVFLNRRTCFGAPGGG